MTEKEFKKLEVGDKNYCFREYLFSNKRGLWYYC